MFAVAAAVLDAATKFTPSFSVFDGLDGKPTVESVVLFSFRVDFFVFPRSFDGLLDLCVIRSIGFTILLFAAVSIRDQRCLSFQVFTFVTRYLCR